MAAYLVPARWRGLLAGVGAVLVLVLAAPFSFGGEKGLAAHSRPLLTRGLRATLPKIGKFVLIMFENKTARQVLDNPAARYFERVAKRYAVLTRYDAVDHPSLPNYLALISGSTQGVESDCSHCTIGATNLVDELEGAGKSWKAYFEGLPYAGYTGPWAGEYTKNVDPFLYFRDIVTNPSRRDRIVPLTAFRTDLRQGHLPNFSFVAPNLCHDMHSCPIDTGDDWLHRFLPPLLDSRQLRDGVVFVVFDEASYRDTAGGGGRVPALVLGDLVRPGVRSSQPLDHYSLLRTVEDAWGLRPLGESADVSPITGIWRRSRAAA